MTHQLQQDSPTAVVGKRYKLISQLGVGGFGQTFLAQDLHLPDCPRCVVKRLVAKTNEPKNLQTARRLFNTEARVLYQLGNHDQIPALFAHFEENQEFYLVQEFVEGEPMTRQIIKGEPWPEDRVIALLKDILEVLVFVHEQNVIHRDVKPSNLMRRRRDGKLVLIDFGAVKRVSVQAADPNTDMADSTVSIGTQGYIPNEQLAGKPRFSSDIYAVGLAGIQALTGVLPRELGEDAQTSELDWRVHSPGVSDELAAILDRMVCYDFRDRYPTAVEALESLRSIAPDATETETRASVTDDDLASTVLLDTAQQPIVTLKQSSATYDFAPTDPKDETLTLSGHTASDSSLQKAEPAEALSQRPVSQQLSKAFQKPGIQRWALVTGVAAAGLALFSLKGNPLLRINQSATPLSAITYSPSPLSPLPPKPLSPEQEADRLVNQANRQRQQRQYTKALASYDKLIKLKPKLAQAHWGRCETLIGLKRPDQAMVACDDALVLNPNYAEALWSQGKALKQQDRSLEALKFFEEATALKPAFVDAWVERGTTLQEFGRSSEAIDALDTAIALDRNSAEAWSTKGSALWNLGRYDQAVSALDKALQIQPTAAGARALRQQARKQLGY
ncbi:protein kinase domain-containing protein [Stenomitos frigidus]|uniref:non-specific serine/threonine protein kinase n=1 Tax=Stenomitos frigidus ULC18 TaxID=2107698 RepID=A0A2T1E511_9CYAN|nr:serine/threonine-protein kinase [Stenomitos frigidus]PSB27734.1 serine/threonine protein kinase [Stenomitos frigidus ULC18]